MKIALLEPLGVSQEWIDNLSQPIRDKGHTFVSYPDKTTEVEELKRRSAECEVVMIANNPYPAEVVESAKALKLLNVAFTGIDHVAQDALKAKGVTVCNAANYSNQSVAELVIGMTISLLRKVTEANLKVRDGGTSAGLVGREIAGRTVGIIGTGKIGMMTAKLFLAFGAKVIAYSQPHNPEAETLGIAYVSLEELLEQSDIVTLHVPSNASTRRMINHERIALMKPHALFINCARGPIVDSKALSDALNEGRIAGAAVDVFDVEPPLPAQEPLLHAKNCLLMPHVAYLTEEAMVRRAHIAFANVEAYLNGEPQNVCAL